MATAWEYTRELTSKAEGGINHDKNDTGNQTKIGGKIYYSNTYYGMTLSTWAKFHNMKTPKSEKAFIALNTKYKKYFATNEEQGKEKVDLLFKKHYWDKHKLDNITDKRVAASIYDAMVNQGLSFGDKGKIDEKGANSSMLSTLKRLGVDISSGFKNLDDAIAQVNKAIVDYTGEKVLNSYAQTRENSYIKSSQNKKKPKNVTFSRGWMDRLNNYRTDGKVDKNLLEIDTALTIDSIHSARINPSYIPEIASTDASKTIPDKGVQPGPTIAAAEGTGEEVTSVSDAIQTDYNAQFNQIQADKKRQIEEKNKETELSSEDDLVLEKKIETEEERIAKEKQEKVDSLAIEKADELKLQQERDLYSQQQTEDYAYWHTTTTNRRTSRTYFIYSRSS